MTAANTASCVGCGAPDAPHPGERRTVPVGPGAVRDERVHRCTACLAAQPDHRLPGLEASIREWLEAYSLVPDADAFLGHGYLTLCLHGWPDATGTRLDVATRWAIWTWLADDLLDGEHLGAEQVSEFISNVDRQIAGYALVGDIHPAASAVLPLAASTRMLMPADWWRDFQREVIEWLLAAQEALETSVRPARVPSLRRYEELRPVDGGMVLAARWAELATATVTDERGTPLVDALLSAFSAVGCLANDLASSTGDVFTIVRALAHAEGLTIEQARTQASALLEAETERFGYLCGVLQEPRESSQYQPTLALSPTGSEVSVNTPRTARNLGWFLSALVEWTATSSRYALAPASAAAGAGQRELCPEESR